MPPNQPEYFFPTYPSAQRGTGYSFFQGVSKLARRIRAVAEPAGRTHAHGRVHSAGKGECNDLTVISANLCHDWPRFRRQQERLEGFARLVENERADLVLLQEVARTQALRVDEWLADRLGMMCVYSRGNGHEAIGFEEGLAVLSRYPLGRPYVRQFASRLNPFVRRLALGAPVETPYGKLLAFSVHLGLLRKQNAAQVRRLVEWIGQMAGEHTALVGGDFNAPEHSRQIAHVRRWWLDTFRHLHPHADGATHTLRWPWGGIAHRSRLDYIFLHAGHARWEVGETRHLETPGEQHSDHRAVMTRLVANGAAPGGPAGQ